MVGFGALRGQGRNRRKLASWQLEHEVLVVDTREGIATANVRVREWSPWWSGVGEKSREAGLSRNWDDRVLEGSCT